MQQYLSLNPVIPKLVDSPTIESAPLTKESLSSSDNSSSNVHERLRRDTNSYHVKVLSSLVVWRWVRRKAGVV